MIEIESTLAALRKTDNSLFIPAGHPLANEPSRQFLNLALDVIDRPRQSAVPDLARWEDEEVTAFVAAEAPVALLAAGYLAAALKQVEESLSALPFSGLAIRMQALAKTQWRNFLLDQLVKRTQRTTILEFNIALMADSDLALEDYCTTLRTPAARERVLAEYPLLGSRLALFVAQQADAFIRFASRLFEDQNLLATVVDCDLSATLPCHINFGEGDFHSGGQAVISLTCEDGSKVVYKPRDIGVEAAFDDLLMTLNGALNDDVFHSVGCLPRDGYGWVRFIEAAPCRTAPEVSHFYQSTGSLLALLHLLGGYDFHHENLIAHGQYPVVVDVETLFFSFKNSGFLGRPDPFRDATSYPAVQALLGSVMGTLLLPQHAREEKISGIAGGDAAPVRGMKYNPERKVLEYNQIGMQEFLNRPVLDGKMVAAEDYADDIAFGFERLYTHVQSNIATYADESGPFGRLAKHTTRIVVRDTQTYATLLEQSWHPTLLGDDENLAIHFLQLWGAAEATPSTIPVFLFEISQLMAGDVPYFMQRPFELEINTSDTRPTGYRLETSGFSAMQARLRSMSRSDLDLQTWIIGGALETQVRKSEGGYGRSLNSQLAEGAADKALQIVHDATMKHALRGNGLLDWLTVTPTPSETLALAPVDVTLYNGISGLTLYLAYYASITGTDQARQDAEMAFANLQRQIDDDGEAFPIPGAMCGLSGAAYCMIHLAVLWQRPELFDEAHRLLTHDLGLITKDDGLYDLMVGAAGLACVASAAFEASQQDRFRKVAMQAAAHLIAAARTDDRGAYWIAEEGHTPLTGLSHGFSGVILALVRVHQIAPDQNFLAHAHDAMLREDMDFVPERNNWNDWRYANLDQTTETDPSDCQAFWCNGSAGIGLVRLALWRAGDNDPQITKDIVAAAKSTFANGLGHNHSLCHGDMGNLDFLDQAAQHLGDGRLKADLDAARARAINSILDGDVFGGASRRVAPPDLMTGLSGVAYGLLRFIAPEAVPDILSLAPPPGQKRT